MRIIQDADKCTGHGRCYQLVPELFEDDEYGHGHPRGDGQITEAQRGAAQRAVSSCPEQAISLSDD